MKLSKKELRRQRMMVYFINAAREIIDKEGIEALTIRKVADLAGYNSATIYNYFTNLDHLISYVAIRDLKEYYLSLEEYIKNAKNAYERFLMIWEKFCIHSYESPEIYRVVFFSNQSIADIFFDYYRFYPSEFGAHSKPTLAMLSEQNIYARNKEILKPLVEEGFLNGSALDEVNDYIIALYRGILALIIDHKSSEKIDVEKEMKKTIKYINKILESYKL
jgi:AcrR family transcriptional regulator